MFQKASGIENVKDKRERGHHDFPSKICCLTVPKNFAGETCVSENFWYRKMLRIREREGPSRLSIETLLSHSTEKLRRGNLCFRKLLVSHILWMRRGAREYHDFQMEIFCLTEPKNFAEEPFCVAETFWYRKMSRRVREGGITTFPRKFVVSPYRGFS